LKKHRWTLTVLHNPFAVLILQIWSMRRTVRRQEMLCVHVMRATDAVTATARSVWKSRHLRPLLPFRPLLLHHQDRTPRVSIWTLLYSFYIIYINLDCCGISSWQTVTHTVLYWPVYSFSLLFSIHLLPFYQPLPDNVWISVSLCCACVCVCVLFTCFLLISRHARPFGWIMSTSAGQCHYMIPRQNRWSALYTLAWLLDTLTFQCMNSMLV